MTTDELDRPVVVGFDGSPSSELAVRFAFSRAQQTGRSLTAVHTWHSSAGHVDLRLSGGRKRAEKEEQALLAERLVPWRERHPEVDVVEKTVRGNAAAALIGESSGAELLVVGGPERSVGRRGGRLVAPLAGPGSGLLRARRSANRSTSAERRTVRRGRRHAVPPGYDSRAART